MKIKTNLRAGSGSSSSSSTVDTSSQNQKQNQGGKTNNTVVSYVPPVYVGRCVGI